MLAAIFDSIATFFFKLLTEGFGSTSVVVNPSSRGVKLPPTPADEVINRYSSITH